MRKTNMSKSKFNMLRRLWLCMAFIMLISHVWPFAGGTLGGLGPLDVSANIPTRLGPTAFTIMDNLRRPTGAPGTAQALGPETFIPTGQTLPVTHEWLVPGPFGIPTFSETPFVYNMLQGRAESGPLIRFHLPSASIADNPFYVVRHFDHTGRRIELTIWHREPGRLTVNFDILERVGPLGSTPQGYRNIRDPFRDDPNDPPWHDIAGNPHAMFQIFDQSAPGDPTPILRNSDDFFSVEFGANFGMPGPANRSIEQRMQSGFRFAPDGGEPWRRVHNRQRFITGAAAVIQPWAGAGFYISQVVSNYPALPLNFPEIHPDPEDTAIRLDDYYDLFYVTPSFDIGLGQGFSFVYHDERVHFLWLDNFFYYQVHLGVPNTGRVYLFEMERFSVPPAGPGAPTGYFHRNVPNMPWIQPHLTPGDHPTFGRVTPEQARQGGMVYYFTGLGRDGVVRNSVFDFPFAQNLINAPRPPDPHELAGSRSPHTLLVVGGAPIQVIGPAYNTEPIVLRDPRVERNRFFAGSYTGPHSEAPFEDAAGRAMVRPAAHPNGIEVRFEPPRFFSEISGRYSLLPHEVPASFPPVGLVASIGIEGLDGVVPSAYASIVVYINLTPLLTNPLNWEAYTDYERPPPGTPGIEGPNYPVVRHVGVWNTDPANTYVYVRIDEFPSSHVIRNANIVIRDRLGIHGVEEIPGTDDVLHPLIFPALRRTELASESDVMHTFLEFDIWDRGRGPIYAHITPFAFDRREGTPVNLRYLYGDYVVYASSRPRIGGVFPTPTPRFTRTFREGDTSVAPIPIFDGGGELAWQVQILFRPNPAQTGGEQLEIWSQIVHYYPGPRDPQVDIPSRFNIRDVRQRVVMPDDPTVCPTFELADIEFTAEWDIATIPDIIRMFQDNLATRSALGVGVTDFIEIRYQIRISDLPHLDSMSDYQAYLDVFVQLREVERPLADGGNFFEIRYMYDVPGGGTVPPLTILNAGEWMFWSPVTNPFMERATIRIATQAAFHEPISVPHPTHRLRFPFVHFFEVEAFGWGEMTFSSLPIDDSLPGTPSPGTADRDLPFDPSLPANLWISNEASLTLDAFEQMRPPQPINVSLRVPPDVADVTISGPALSASFELSRPGIYSYLEQMHDFIPYFSTNLYVGTFETTILNNFINREPPPNRAQRQAASTTVQFDPEWGWAVDFSTVTVGGSSLRDLMRQGNVIRIENIPPDFGNIPNASPSALDHFEFIGGEPPSEVTPVTSLDNTLEGLAMPVGAPNPRVDLLLHGLDENLPHFAFADLVIVPYILVTGAAINATTPAALVAGPIDCDAMPMYSIFSNLAGDTTGTEPDRPIPPEIEATAPLNFRIVTVGQNSVSLTWDPVTPIPQTRVEYELIRIETAQPMSTQLMLDTSPENTLHRVMELLTPTAVSVKGWRTNDGVFEVARPGGTWAAAGPGTAFPEYSLEGLLFTDNTLTPNTLYFYYLRTVLVYEDEDPETGVVREFVSRSVWVECPVTTYPVGSPIRLRVSNPIGQPGFDEESMFFVEWDLVFPDSTLYGDALVQDMLSRLGVSMHFEFELDQDAAGDPVFFFADLQQFPLPTRVFAGSDPDTGDPMVTFRYMLTGLRPSTFYHLRVRQAQISGTGSFQVVGVSLWSNFLPFMTGGEDDGIDDEAGDWVDEIRRRLEEILRRPFWVVQDTPTRLVVAYRPHDMFLGPLNAPLNHPIDLFNTDANYVTYYLPQTIVNRANEERRPFSSTFSDMQVLLAAGLFNPAHNQPFIDMRHLVNNRTTYVTDFFVRLNIDRQPSGNVHGSPALGRQTYITTQLIGTHNRKRNIETWDRDVERRARQIVDDALTEPMLVQSFVALITEGADSWELLTFVEQTVARVSYAISADVRRDFTATEEFPSGALMSGDVLQITTFDAPMHLIATNTSANMSVRAWQLRVGQWVGIDRVYYNQNPAIQTRIPGTFVFTGVAISIPGIHYEPQGQAMTGIVARFGLDHVLGANVDLMQNATRQQVISSIASLANAPRSADPIAWAAATLDVPFTRNPAQLISWQETVAFVMALYEINTSRRITTIVIRNQHATAGMTLDPRYTQAVRAALELGITPPNQGPAGPVTLGEFLNMLVIVR